ncbi:MAG: aspartate aminotransferase family protein [Acidobacteriaceae bacterium]|nr:aspartate aminotransferase family protein [Acidobacteriaceae bacterium]
MGDNFPYFHPLYAGQMLKPPHPIARAAYAMASWLNPNNHALDGGRASSAMEVEAVREIAAMFGWTQHLGHLTSGGTFANLEALWVAGRLAPGKATLASYQAHYTHARISAVLQLPFRSIAVDGHGRMDLRALEKELATGNIGTVVATLGTTALGAVDPLDEILALRDRYGFRLHVDAAYGGYFKLASNLRPEAARAFARIGEADSIVIDPHKHGLQPYGCGCILFRDPAVGRFYKHDSPYTYFTSSDLHLGEISLECSRAGASAVALWATQRLLPLVPGGDFAQGLERSIQAARTLYAKIAADHRFVPGPQPQLDIITWAIASPSVEESFRLAKQVFDRAARQDLHLALVQLPVAFFRAAATSRPGQHQPPWASASPDAKVTCLRSVLMKPEHLEWIDEIWNRLKMAAGP